MSVFLQTSRVYFILFAKLRYNFELKAKFDQKQFETIMADLFKVYIEYLKEHESRIVLDENIRKKFTQIIESPSFFDLPNGCAGPVFNKRHNELNLSNAINHKFKKMDHPPTQNTDPGRHINIERQKITGRKKDKDNEKEKVVFELEDWVFVYIGKKDARDYRKSKRWVVSPGDDLVSYSLLGNWEIYYYNNRGVKGQGRIAMARLEFQGDGRVELFEASESEEQCTYRGQIIDDPQKSNLVIDLTLQATESRQIKSLTISVIIPRNPNPSLLIGHYTNLSDSLGLVRGTVLLMKSKEPIVPRVISPDQMSGLENEIELFFRYPALSFNELPSTVGDISTLNEWLNQSLDKDYERYDEYRYMGQNTLLVSFPYNSFVKPKGAIDEWLEIIQNIREATIGKGKNGFSSVSSIYEIVEEKQLSNHSIPYEDLRTILNDSSHHLIIWPDGIKDSSSLFFQLGWSAHENKKVLIYREETAPRGPNLIEGAIQSNTNRIVLCTYTKLDDIVNDFELKGASLFRSDVKSIYSKSRN